MGSGERYTEDNMIIRQQRVRQGNRWVTISKKYMVARLHIAMDKKGIDKRRNNDNMILVIELPDGMKPKDGRIEGWRTANWQSSKERSITYDASTNSIVLENKRVGFIEPITAASKNHQPCNTDASQNPENPIYILLETDENVRGKRNNLNIAFALNNQRGNFDYTSGGYRESICNPKSLYISHKTPEAVKPQPPAPTQPVLVNPGSRMRVAR